MAGIQKQIASITHHTSTNVKDAYKIIQTLCSAQNSGR